MTKNIKSSITLRIDEKDKILLEQYAQINDMSLSAIIRVAIKEYMQNHPLE